MTSKLIRVLLVPSAALSMLSCGGNGGEPLTATNAGFILGELNTIMKSLPRNGGTLNLPSNGISTAAKPSNPSIKTILSDCETVTPASPVDADGDGIAAIKTGTFDCNGQPGSGGNTYSRKGSYSVKDQDDSKAWPEAGVDITYNIDKFESETTSGDKFRTSYKGNHSYASNGSTLTSSSDFTGTYYFSSPTYNFETDYTYVYTWSWSQTPDNFAAPWTTGKNEFSGTYSLSGKFHAEDASGNHYQHNGTWVIKYYGKNLKYNSACNTAWFESGSMFMEDGNGSVFEFRYNCTSIDLYINGTKSDLFTVN